MCELSLVFNYTCIMLKTSEEHCYLPGELMSFRQFKMYLTVSFASRIKYFDLVTKLCVSL